MKSPIARRLATLLSILAMTLMLGGCLPGQFPIPPDRSAPPKPSKKAVSSSSGYFHGGFAPLTTDASD